MPTKRQTEAELTKELAKLEKLLGAPKKAKIEEEEEEEEETGEEEEEEDTSEDDTSGGGKSKTTLARMQKELALLKKAAGSKKGLAGVSESTAHALLESIKRITKIIGATGSVRWVP